MNSEATSSPPDLFDFDLDPLLSRKQILLLVVVPFVICLVLILAIPFPLYKGVIYKATPVGDATEDLRKAMWPVMAALTSLGLALAWRYLRDRSPGPRLTLGIALAAGLAWAGLAHGGYHAFYEKIYYRKKLGEITIIEYGDPARWKKTPAGTAPARTPRKT